MLQNFTDIQVKFTLDYTSRKVVSKKV